MWINGIIGINGIKGTIGIIKFSGVTTTKNKKIGWL